MPIVTRRHRRPDATPTPRPPTLRSCSGFVALLLTALVLLVARPAAAQGTSGQLPDPISLQDLTMLLDRYVAATPAQWEKIDGFHTRYKDDFKKLRDGEIQKFLDDARKLQSQGGMPDRKVVEEYFKDQQQIESRIRALDNRLFDEIQGALDETQTVAMPRVRLARERSTYRNPMSMGVLGAMPVDLTEILSNLQLTRSQIASLDPELVPYENQLTRELSKLHSSMGRMMVDLIDALTAEGFGDIDEQEMMADPEKLRGMMEAMSRAWMQIGAKARESAADIAKLNHRARRAIAQKLPPETARKLLKEFVARGYPMMGSAAGNAESQLKAATRLRAIDDAQRDALQQVLEAWYVEDARLTEEFIKQSDDRAGDRSMFDMSPERWETMQKEMTERQEKRTAVDTAALDRAKGIVGPELAEKIDQARGETLAEADFLVEASVDAGDVAADELDGPGRRSFGGDGLLPPQISNATIAGWSRQLGLSASDRSIVEALHADYIARWQKDVSPKIAAISSATSRLYRGSDDGAPRVDVSAVDELYDARTQAIAAIDVVDAEFLDAIRLIFEDETRRAAIDLIALDRSLAGVNAFGMYGGFAENREGETNLAALVAEAIEEADDFPAARKALLQHAETLTTTTRELRRASLRNQQAMERFNARFMATGDGTSVPPPDDAAQVDMQKSSEALTAALTARRDATRTALADVRAAISQGSAAKVRRAFNRDAFPNVFNDRDSAERLLTRALTLSDLDDVQRVAIQSLERNFLEQYDALSDRMLAELADSTSPAGNDPEAWRTWQEQRGKVARIRFERDDLNTRTVRQLRQLLTEAQIQRVPGLAQHGAQRRERGMFELPD